jgi:CRISPR/Cas system-associated exonuclease Cas4 (RecB family)
MKAPYETLLDEQAALFQEIAERRKSGDTDIRFGRPWVAASSIADQFYCEQKVELRRLLGEIETEVKQRGSEAHEALASEALEINRKDLFQRIFSDQLTIAQECLLMSHYKGLILVGQPDAVVFHQGCALYLFEFKFSHSRFPYYSHHVQANVYGKILEGMGFDVNTLRYVIAIIPPSSQNEGALFTNIVETVMDHGSREETFTIGDVSIHVYTYHSTQAVADIDWALEYWRNTRDAIPTRNPNKCTRCEYIVSCQLKPDAFTVSSEYF